MLNPALARQSLGRALTESEAAFAAALEAIFAAGTQDFGTVAAELEAREIARPSGAARPWTREQLERELAVINQSLDAAYERDGIGA